MNEKILVVDDEKEIADLLEVYLKNDNYIVHKYYNGIEALECIQKTEIDLAILDVMLPDIDGFRICQKIRENFYFPVIMLTAKIDDGDKIMGLTIGADDYITKPAKVKILKTDFEKNISRLEITIHEGKNHQIKKMLESVGNKVIKLRRERYANLNLKGLMPGEYRPLTIKEVKILYSLCKK